MKVLIIGCGFLGEAAADLFLADGARVFGVCGSEKSAAQCRGRKFAVRVLDISSPFHLEGEWARAEIAVFCASTRGGGAAAYSRLYFDGVANLVAASSHQKIIFASSTSVYAQTDGELVSETDPANPAAPTGTVLRKTEDLLLSRESSCILRLAALYGPGRSVPLKRYLEGAAINENGGSRWLNHIHRDDAARAIVHAAQRDLRGIYNAADNRPFRQKELYSLIASHFGGAPPPDGPAPPNRKRGLTNKRVSNTKLRAAGWEPAYPDFGVALEAGAVSPSK